MRKAKLYIKLKHTVYRLVNLHHRVSSQLKPSLCVAVICRLAGSFYNIKTSITHTIFFPEHGLQEYHGSSPAALGPHTSRPPVLLLCCTFCLAVVKRVRGSGCCCVCLSYSRAIRLWHRWSVPLCCSILWLRLFTAVNRLSIRYSVGPTVYVQTNNGQMITGYVIQILYNVCKQ